MGAATYEIMHQRVLTKEILTHVIKRNVTYFPAGNEILTLKGDDMKEVVEE